MAFSKPVPAEPAADGEKRGRGRPKGTSVPRVRTTKFEVKFGVEAFAELCCTKYNQWQWDGKSYPKTKRSHGPNVDSLAQHSEPLKVLMRLAPNGYPDPYRLRDLLVQLQYTIKIFDGCQGEEHLAISNRAALASDRWGIMCKHLVMLKKCGQDYGNQQIKELLDVMTLGSESPAEPAEAPAPAEVAAAPAPAEPAEGPPPSAEATPE